MGEINLPKAGAASIVDSYVQNTSKKVELPKAGIAPVIDNYAQNASQKVELPKAGIASVVDNYLNNSTNTSSSHNKLSSGYTSCIDRDVLKQTATLIYEEAGYEGINENMESSYDLSSLDEYLLKEGDKHRDVEGFICFLKCYDALDKLKEEGVKLHNDIVDLANQIMQVVEIYEEAEHTEGLLEQFASKFDWDISKLGGSIVLATDMNEFKGNMDSSTLKKIEEITGAKTSSTAKTTIPQKEEDTEKKTPVSNTIKHYAATGASVTTNYVTKSITVQSEMTKEETPTISKREETPTETEEKKPTVTQTAKPQEDTNQDKKPQDKVPEEMPTKPTDDAEQNNPTNKDESSKEPTPDNSPTTQEPTTPSTEDKKPTSPTTPSKPANGNNGSQQKPSASGTASRPVDRSKQTLTSSAETSTKTPTEDTKTDVIVPEEETTPKKPSKVTIPTEEKIEKSSGSNVVPIGLGVAAAGVAAIAGARYLKNKKENEEGNPEDDNYYVEEEDLLEDDNVENETNEATESSAEEGIQFIDPEEDNIEEEEEEKYHAGTVNKLALGETNDDISIEDDYLDEEEELE